MPTTDNNTILDKALAAPEGEQNLQRFIAVFNQKHPALLIIKQGSPVQRLTAMLVQYSQLLPILIEEARWVAARDHCAAEFSQLHTVVGTFFSGLEARRLEFGILGILDKVYFGHRLLEEWHDRRRLVARGAALSWDTSLANLLAHILIGDTYANELDAAVLEMMEAWPQLHSGIGAQPYTSEAPCPCLAARHGVYLSWVSQH
jgi:hypothetical protein